MNLIAESTQKTPSKQKMTKAQVISLLKSNSNLMDEEEDLTEFINGLDWTKGLDVVTLKKEFDRFRDEKYNKEVARIAYKYGLQVVDLKAFIDKIMDRMIFDGEKLTDLLEPLDLGWKERRERELALMSDLVPHLKKLAQGRVISGLTAYE
jgi:type I restriction enzyme R subunit